MLQLCQVQSWGPGGGAVHHRRRQDNLRQCESLQVSGCNDNHTLVARGASGNISATAAVKTSHIETQ